MKKNMGIVFMGTPDFAVASLKAVIDAGYEVKGVVTAPDRPAGRGRKMQESAVKRFATEKGITVLQPLRLKDPEFLDKLKSLGADVFVVVAFRMLPAQVWKMPPLGTFNLHASLLPDYRGAAPINWAVINGESRSGVTTFFIDDKIDTGEIILQKETDIAPGESAGELHDRLMQLGAGLVTDTLNAIAAGTISTQPQKESEKLRPAPKLDKETARIDWHLEGKSIYNHIRGLSPYPGAWAKLENKGERQIVKIFKAKLVDAEHGLENGHIVVEEGQLKVAVAGGFLSLEELQLQGKRRLGVREVLNGLHLEEGAHMC